MSEQIAENEDIRDYLQAKLGGAAIWRASNGHDDIAETLRALSGSTNQANMGLVRRYRAFTFDAVKDAELLTALESVIESIGVDFHPESIDEFINEVLSEIGEGVDL